MSLNDPISNALSKILNAEKVGKSTCTFKPISKVLKKILDIMKDEKYIGDYKEIEDGKGNYIEINLLGNINSCGAVKPRYPVSRYGFEKFEKRYLPATGFGLIIVSTSQGIMKHTEAIDKKIGGKLLAFIY